MNNDIRHYGVLGMKWGVRKSDEDQIAKKAMGLYKRTDNMVSTVSQETKDKLKSQFRISGKSKTPSDTVTSTSAKPTAEKTVPRYSGQSSGVPALPNIQVGDKSINEILDELDATGVSVNDLYNKALNAFGGEENFTEIAEKIANDGITPEILNELAANVDMNSLAELADVSEDFVVDNMTDLMVSVVGQQLGIDDETAKKISEGIKTAHKTVKNAAKKGKDFVVGVYDRSIDTTKGYIGKGKSFVDGIIGLGKGTYNKAVDNTKKGFAEMFRKKK